MTRSAAKKLADVLAQERLALLKGDYEHLERLLPEKEKALSLLSKTLLPEPELSHLQNLCNRNHSLLMAAIDGVSDAKALLRAASAPQQTTTYGPAGQRATLHDPPQTLSRKF